AAATLAGDVANQLGRAGHLLTGQVLAHGTGFAERIGEIAIAQRHEHATAGGATMKRGPLVGREVITRCHGLKYGRAARIGLDSAGCALDPAPWQASCPCIDAVEEV